MIRWSLVNKIGRLLEKLTGDQEKDVSQLKDKKGLKPLILMVSLIDVLFFYVYAFYMVRIKRLVLICDRYFYDLGIQALYTGVMRNTFEKFYWNLVTSPTHGFVLDADPQTLKAREGDHEISYYERKRDMYLERTSLWGCDVIQAGEIENMQREMIEHLSLDLEEPLVS